MQTLITSRKVYVLELIAWVCVIWNTIQLCVYKDKSINMMSTLSLSSKDWNIEMAVKDYILTMVRVAVHVQV